MAGLIGKNDLIGQDTVISFGIRKVYQILWEAIIVVVPVRFVTIISEMPLV